MGVGAGRQFPVVCPSALSCSFQVLEAPFGHLAPQWAVVDALGGVGPEGGQLGDSWGQVFRRRFCWPRFCRAFVGSGLLFAAVCCPSFVGLAAPCLG